MLEPDPDIRASRKPEATERFSYLATAMERELREIELHVDSGSNGVDATMDLIRSHSHDALLKTLP